MAEPVDFSAPHSIKSLGNGWMLLIACVLLSAQALPYFQHRWIEDESWYSMPAATLVLTGELRNPALPATDYESLVDTRPPLMPLILSAEFRLFGFRVAAARIGEFLAALLTLLVVFAIGLELGDPIGGTIAGLLAASDTFLVLSARTARPEAWVTLCVSCGLLMILRSHNRQSWKHAFVAGLAVAAGSMFHVLGLAWFLGLGLVLLYQTRRNIFRSPGAYAYVAAFAIALIPFAIWLFGSPEHIEAAKHMYGRTAGSTAAQVFSKEKLRILDFLGFSNQRLHLPFPIPLRLHIALAITVAFGVLWRRRSHIFWQLVIVTATYLFWLLRLPNPSPRYYAILAPVFGLSMGLATTALVGTRWHRAAMAVCGLCIVSQIGGTALILTQAREANYTAIKERLRVAIPAGHSCYGAMTFQFALFDRGCHSYDRTPFSYTSAVQRPEYMILGDRVMMHGSGRGEDEFSDVREQAFAFVKGHGQLTARIDDPFYGQLTVYHITYDPLN